MGAALGKSNIISKSKTIWQFKVKLSYNINSNYDFV